LTNAQAVGTGITATFSSVFRTNTGVNQSLFSGNGNEYNLHAPWSDGNTYFDVSNGGTGRLSGALTWTSLSTGTFLRNGAIAEIYRNGVNSLNSNSRNTSFTFSNSTINLFSFGTNSNYLQGVVPEMIFFSTPLSSPDRVTIENNQNCYYNLGVFSSSVDWSVRGTPAASACSNLDEQVVWKSSDLSNVAATSNNLIKNQSNGSWNGGAASINTVSNNGYLQFTVAETNTLRAIGLSTTNANANFTSIQYAVYLRNDGQYEVYESGTLRANFGAYASNDVFKIFVDAGVVKYFRNGTLFYTSAVAPTLPLLVDVSINSLNGTVSNVIVSNFASGNYTAALGGSFPSVSYQWKLNGSNVGTNSTSYSNPTLNTNDVISCVATFQVGGCTQSLASNNLTVLPVASQNSVDIFITSTLASSACNTAEEQVKWRASDLTNVNIFGAGNNLLKVQSNGNWDGGAASRNTVSNLGFMQFTATEINTERMVGLSNTNVNSNFNTIQYAVYLRNNGQFEVYESGSSRGNFGSYFANDVFRIGVDGNVIKYFRNGNLFYTSGVAPTLPLLVDVSINTIDGTVSNVIVSNYSTGFFTATAINAGGSPSYQWKLNGNNVGTNSATYSNATLSNNDVISCVLTPTVSGCSNASFTSNSITNKTIAAPVTIDFYIAATAVVAACNNADEQVDWRTADLANTIVTGSGNSLIKTQSTNWDGGAASYNRVSNNGYMQFTA
ncbi:MAG: hypothetical protein WCK82_14890, partial [Bacteroidota bacterium]